MANIFKNYKQLYQTELNNRKLYEERYKEIYDEKIALQMQIKELQKNIAKLERKIKKADKEKLAAKEESAKAKIDLEDCQGFLAQEIQAKRELLKQRTELRTKVTKLGGSWDNE